MGVVPSIEVHTGQGDVVTIRNVHLEIDVDSEMLEHHSMGEVTHSVVINEKISAKAITDDKAATEELWRLIRED